MLVRKTVLDQLSYQVYVLDSVTIQVIVEYRDFSIQFLSSSDFVVPASHTSLE